MTRAEFVANLLHTRGPLIVPQVHSRQPVRRRRENICLALLAFTCVAGIAFMQRYV